MTAIISAMELDANGFNQSLVDNHVVDSIMLDQLVAERTAADRAAKLLMLLSSLQGTQEQFLTLLGAIDGCLQYDLSTAITRQLKGWPHALYLFAYIVRYSSLSVKLVKM